MEWFDDYYDDCVESVSEADAIIADAKEKLVGILKDTVKEDMEKAKAAEKKLAELTNSIESKQRELSRIDKKLQEEIRKAEDEESNMPQRYVDKFVRKYTGGYAAGDIVYVVKSRDAHSACPMCQGKKKVSAMIDGEEMIVRCPTCLGDGIIWGRKYEIEKREVVDVHLTLCFCNGYDRRNVRNWNTETIVLRGESKYRSTEGLYKTEEEAKEALKALEG